MLTVEAALEPYSLVAEPVSPKSSNRVGLATHTARDASRSADATVALAAIVWDRRAKAAPEASAATTALSSTTRTP